MALARTRRGGSVHPQQGLPTEVRALVLAIDDASLSNAADSEVLICDYAARFRFDARRAGSVLIIRIRLSLHTFRGRFRMTFIA